MANEALGIKSKLAKADAIIRDFVVELMSRNGALQRQIVKLEADLVERDNRIKALERARKDEHSK